MKCHHPEVFCAALLNSQPMGFYQPAQLVRDAREHGVEVRAAGRRCQRLGLHAGSAGRSAHAAPRAVRLGLRQIKGLKRRRPRRFMAGRARRALPTLSRTMSCARGLSRRGLELLAEADAFRVARA